LNKPDPAGMYRGIRFNFLSEPEDVQEMVEGAHLLRRFAQTPALSAIIEREYKPGPEVRKTIQRSKQTSVNEDTRSIIPAAPAGWALKQDRICR
jgi:hypothetical protein